MECTSYHKKLVPLRRVVAASIIDKYEDLGRMQEYHTHWAARGLRKLQSEVLKKGRRYAMLTINKNTNTATLPPDFDYETFIGTLFNGIKIPLRLRSDIPPHSSYLETISGEDKCNTCEQPKAICNDLHITEEVIMVTIDGVEYEEKIIKKLYPNGDYFLEKITPVKDFQTNAITTVTTKEFITNLDLKDCGCLETTDDNLCKLEAACPEVYSCYFASCECECLPENGSYRVFEELNIIQFYGIRVDKVYIEYISFITKISGQYYVPEVAFETLVQWIKFKSVENKKGVPLYERNWFLEQYKRERRNMEIILGRVSLSVIINAVGLTPKFNFYSGNDWYWRFCGNAVTHRTDHTETTTSCESESIQVSPSGDTIIRAGEVLQFNKKKFQVGAIGSLLEVNETILVINEKNIKPDSLHVVLDASTIWEYSDGDVLGSDDVVGYRVTYNLNNVVITFNSPVVAEQNIQYRMQKLFRSLVFAVSLFISYASYSQTPQPNTLPIVKSQGWVEYGYVRALNGVILPVRDTSWIPRYPTLIEWRRAGIDTSLWFYDTKWRQVGSSGANNYPLAVSFATGTGALTITRSGLSSITTSLDGRYLLPATAASTYLTQATAASTYLTQATAASTYLTQASAASGFQPLDGDLTSLAALSGVGIVKRTGTNTYSLLTDNTANWNSAYNGVIVSGAVTGTTTKTITLTKQDASTVTFNFTDDGGTVINGTGFVKASGATISYDNSTYLTTADAASTYLTQANATSTYQTLANINTSTTMVGASNTNYPSALAIKTYVDNSIAGAGGYTDEAAQDAFAAMASSEFTYVDATPLLSINTIAQSKITNLTTDLAGKQATLVSGTNIKTVNGVTLLGSGDITTGTVTGVTGTVNRITSTGGTAPVIDIASTYVGQTSITTLGTIGTGTWQGTAVADAYIASAATWNAKQAALVSGTNIKTVNGTSILGSGDLVISSGANSLGTYLVQTATNAPANAQIMGALGTGIVKNTTTTGVQSIAVAADFPILNQNTTGSAATLTTARTIQGVSFDGSANINIINGTGFVKAVGTTISYDNSTYLTTADAASTYLTQANATSTYQTLANINTSTTMVGASNTNYPSALAIKTYVDNSIAGAGGYTDEAAQDAIGAMVSSEFTYADATPLLSINEIAQSKITNLVTDLGNKQATLGGTGIVNSTAGTISYIAGTGNQLLRRNAGNTAYEFFTPTYITSETDPNAVLLTGNQTVAGVKTFSSAIQSFGVNWFDNNSANMGTLGYQTVGSFNYGQVQLQNAENGFTGTLRNVVLSASRLWEFPDKNGTVAMLSDITGGTTTTINNNADNRLITGSGTANTLEGENNATFDGNVLSLIATATDKSILRIGTIEVQPYGLNNAWFGENVYFDGVTSFVHRQTGAAGLFYFLGDEGQFRMHASRSAGQTVFADQVQFKVRSDGTVAIGGQIITAQGSLVGAQLIATTTGVTITSLNDATGVAKMVTTNNGVLGYQAIPSGGSGANSLGTYLVQTATNAPANAQIMGALGTGIVKNTTTTGVQSIAVAGTDYLTPTGSAASLTSFPTFNQSTTGSAATLTTTRAIYGNNFNGSADVTAVISPTYGGTGVNNATRTLTINTNSGTIAFTSAASTLTVAATGSISGTNTGDQTTVSGNAGTATALQTARTINGVSFDGTANITVAAAAGTLTDATLASGVTASSLTSFGTSPTIVTPTIASFINSAHNHTNAAGGGQLTDAALSAAVTVPKGGTALTSLTAYAVMTGGTTTTGAMQQVSGLGTTGQVLTSNGAAALPTWQAASGGTTLNGTGYVKMAGTTPSYVATIPSADLPILQMTAHTMLARVGATTGDVSEVALGTNQLIGRDEANIQAITVGSGLDLTSGILTASGGGLSAIANNTILGNFSGASAVPVSTTMTTLTNALNVFTTTTQGVVPVASGGSTTTQFLRKDGTWAAPAGGSSSGVSGLAFIVGTTTNAPANAATYVDMSANTANKKAILFINRTQVPMTMYQKNYVDTRLFLLGGVTFKTTDTVTVFFVDSTEASALVVQGGGGGSTTEAASFVDGGGGSMGAAGTFTFNGGSATDMHSTKRFTGDGYVEGKYNYVTGGGITIGMHDGTNRFDVRYDGGTGIQVRLNEGADLATATYNSALFYGIKRVGTTVTAYSSTAANGGGTVVTLHTFAQAAAATNPYYQPYTTGVGNQVTNAQISGATLITY